MAGHAGLKSRTHTHSAVNRMQAEINALVRGKSRDAVAKHFKTDIGIYMYHYGRLFTSLYAAVNAAAADYTDIINMKDPPSLGEVIFDSTLDAMTLFDPAIGAICKTMRGAIEKADTVKEKLEPVTAAAKGLFTPKQGDPNASACLRMRETRRFFAQLDKAGASLEKAFARALKAIDDWDSHPHGSLHHLVEAQLGFKLRFAVPGKEPDTNLFTDFFLYDLLAMYTRKYVSVGYYTSSGPYGEFARPHVRDLVASAAYVEGLGEASREDIYKTFGKNGTHAVALIHTFRPLINDFRDLVLIWGARFYRNATVQDTTQDRKEARHEAMVGYL